MKILVKIKDQKLEFLNRKKLNTEYKNMLNTNVISHDELVFSDQYVKENYKILATFFSELIKTNNIYALSFQNMEVALLIMPIFNKIKNVNTINFASEEVLPYKICEHLIKCNNIKYISAEYIPSYMFELLDKYGIIPESRNEILFTSNFMSFNHLANYSNIFYKYTIYLEFPLSPEDFLDFEAFCKINQHLRVIHINEANKFNLEELIFLLKEYKHKHVKIFIHGDVHDEELTNYLKKHNKTIKKKYKITLKLAYSEKYIEENIVKQTNVNILRACALFMVILSILSVGLILVDNYKSMKNVAKIQNEIQTYIVAKEKEEVKEEHSNLKNKYISDLMGINNDVIAWLKVNDTNIDYAVLQTKDNKYYLDYNIYKEKDPNGWLFLDCDNNINPLDDNMIIYGHNRFINGVMFGTLNKALYYNWYTNPDNQIISFDTMYDSYKYQIFSIYTVPTTSDYLQNNFTSSEEKINFLNTIKNRSIHNFEVNFDENSKIITLSTCQDDSTRLVVHGLLINNN